MPNYSYEAIGSDGEEVSGEITAPRVSDAISQLEAQGLQVESIRAVISLPDVASARKAFYDRIDKSLERRDSLVPALDALADEMAQRGIARDVRQFALELKSGVNAEQFVKKESTAAWLPLIVRGLESHSTADRYGQLMDDATRESENRKSLRTVLAYPLFLLAFSTIIIIFMMTIVVPIFAKMLVEFGLNLPAPTRILFWTSDQITGHPFRSLLVVMLVFLTVAMLCRIWVRLALSTTLLGMFTSGNSANVTAMAKFTGALAELVSIDAPLPEAFRIAGRASEHRHFRVMSERLANELEVPGTKLSNVSVAHNFPATVRYALGVEGNRAPNVALLRELSRMYTDRVRGRLSWSTSILGPTSLVVLGLLVGFVIIALFMPLFSLLTALA